MIAKRRGRKGAVGGVRLAPRVARTAHVLFSRLPVLCLRLKKAVGGNAGPAVEIGVLLLRGPGNVGLAGSMAPLTTDGEFRSRALVRSGFWVEVLAEIGLVANGAACPRSLLSPGAVFGDTYLRFVYAKRSLMSSNAVKH